ncbi:minor capsid protein [Campylobacter showae]|uniref:minor capsid protein n=1 Tax=Campylobacter showae TaxID=204 RepID=UPI000F073717|nr:minor capsid protein [Campylobacter showae]
MKPFNQLIAELEVARSLLHERIKNGLSKKVAKFYDDMIADLQAQILKKKNITNNLAQAISDLKQSLKTPDLRKDFLTLAQNEQDHLLDYNELAGFNLFSSVLPEASIERLVDSAQLEGATVKAWNNGLNADQKKRLERELKIGVSLGETTPMLAQRIAQVLQKNKRDATAIALTGAGAIVSEIRQAFFEANAGVIKCYKYQATLDTRTSELCRAYDGLIWDKDYKPIGHNFPFRKPRVNTHFNCRSTIIPVTKSWDELGVEGMDEASGRTRSSMNGYVPQDMTFNDWLKTQSPETIEKTLGKGRAELFMQGKITMRDLITQQGRALDLRDIYKKKKLNEYDTRNVKHFDIPRKLAKRINLKTDTIRGSIDYLYEKHPEMFINKDDLKNQIIDALRNPEFIKEATFKADGVIIGKSIDDKKKKMIDIGININDGVIFHINKKRWDTTMKALKNR